MHEDRDESITPFRVHSKVWGFRQQCEQQKTVMQEPHTMLLHQTQTRVRTFIAQRYNSYQVQTWNLQIQQMSSSYCCFSCCTSASYTFRDVSETPSSTIHLVKSANVFSLHATLRITEIVSTGQTVVTQATLNFGARTHTRAIRILHASYLSLIILFHAVPPEANQ